VLKAEDNPGTFYNYKTPEYYERIGDGSLDRLTNVWMMPLQENPQFTQERIHMYKSSGLEGEDLSKAFMGEFKEH